MIKLPVKLASMQDGKYLVQIAEGCNYDVELVCGRYIVDAKSMLGVFSLPHFDNVELILHTDNGVNVKEQLAQLNLLKTIYKN